MTQDQMDAWEEAIRNFFANHTKEELSTWAIDKGVPLTPVNSVADAVALEQLKARHFWVEVPYPKLGTSITQPGPFCKSTEPMCEIRRRAPSIGEHNAEILGSELGLSSERLATLQQDGVI
jgi:formyl-CoA transferase